MFVSTLWCVCTLSERFDTRDEICPTNLHFLGIVTPLRMTEWQKYVRHVHLDNSYSFM